MPPFSDVSLHWLLDVEYRLRGGVLCDAIGFGKTAVVLAAVALSKDGPVQLPQFPLDREPGRKLHSLNYIPCKATLVVLPSHLLAQWQSEVQVVLHLSVMGHRCLICEVSCRLSSLRALICV